MTSSDESKGARSRDEVLAGEYVLGALSAEARLKVEERMMRDRGFAAIVNRWAQSASTFSDEPGIGPQSAEAVGSMEGGHAPRPPRGAVSRLWNSIVVWRLLAITSLLVAAGIGFMRSNPGDRAGSVIAELTGEGNAFSLNAIYDKNSGRMRLAPAAPGKPGGGALQLWLLSGDAPARPLGVLPQTGASEIEIPVALRSEIAIGSTLAVSLEPTGGSPTGKASGPFVAQGAARSP